MSQRATGDCTHGREEQMIQYRLYLSLFLLTVALQGSATREIVFSPKLEDAGRENLKADAGPFLTQYWT